MIEIDIDYVYFGSIYLSIYQSIYLNQLYLK